MKAYWDFSAMILSRHEILSAGTCRESPHWPNSEHDN